MALPAEIKTLFDTVYSTLLADWAKLQATIVSTGWFSFNLNMMSSAWQFVVAGIEQLVATAETTILVGEDKKAAVLAYAKGLFDNIIAINIPLPFRPFFGMFETVLLSALSGIIEYVVAKLHGKPPAPAPTPAPIVPTPIPVVSVTV